MAYGDHEYQTLLITMNSRQSNRVKLDKLTKLRIETEDPAFRDLVKQLENAVSNSGGVPDNWVSYVATLKTSTNAVTSGQRVFVNTFDAVTLECEAAIKAKQPRWQQIALAAGWTPPVLPPAD